MTELPRHDDGAADELLAERYGIPNPHRDEFTLGDLGAGVVAGIALMLATGITGGLVLTWLELHEVAFVIAVAPFVAIPLLVAVGWPVAALGAWLLRPVPWDWLHLVAFGVLGAAASVISLAAMGGVLFSPLVLPAMLYAVLTAIVARIVGRRAGIRRFARDTAIDDAWFDDDDE